MTKPNEQQLLRLVTISDDVNDLYARVERQLGAEHIPAARIVALRTNGDEWVFGRKRLAPPNTVAALKAVLVLPTNFVLAIGTLLLSLVLLFPPFQLILQHGMALHTGFFFILDEKTSGAVNVALLAIECLGVLGVTVAAYLLAQRVEREMKGR